MRTMRSAVALAAEARRRFLATQAPSDDAHQTSIRIALSLGPFGATLSPGQEYGGLYPPPYGPQAYATGGENRVGFTKQEIDAGEESAAVDALAAFHLARLRVFAEDRTTWDELDVLAFETIPVAREICAVRKAMATLIKEGGVESKPFWISAVFPSGRSPEGGNEDGTSGASRFVAAAIDVADGLETPTGIGINCTPPHFVGGLVEELRAELATRKVKPWLVLYPNGGGIYDPVSRTWDEGEHEKGTEVGGWVTGLADFARREEASGTWSRVVVGGCCKASPEDIRALAQIIKD
jgi:homocysteine S-methyltransferase